MNKLILAGVIFIILGVVLVLLYFALFPSQFFKGVFALSPGSERRINIPYTSFLFAYTDNVSKPLNVSFQSASVLNYKIINNSYFYYYGNSYYGSVIISNNYTYPVLLGFSVVNYSSAIIFLPFLEYVGLALVLLGALLLLFYYTLFKRGKKEEK